MSTKKAKIEVTKLSRQTIVDFNIVFAKGPVNHESSQRAFERSYSAVRPFLTSSEHAELMVAHSHATGFSNEGRGEWDDICKRIRKRIFENE